MMMPQCLRWNKRPVCVHTCTLSSFFLCFVYTFLRYFFLRDIVRYIMSSCIILPFSLLIIFPFAVVFLYRNVFNEHINKSRQFFTNWTHSKTVMAVVYALASEEGRRGPNHVSIDLYLLNKFFKLIESNSIRLN